MSFLSSCQCLIGLQCNSFTMIAADQTKTLSFAIVKHDQEKLHELSDRLLLGVNGDTGDDGQFSQFVAKNMHLYKMRNGYELSTAAAAHFTRKNLDEFLKSGYEQVVNILMGGYDETVGAQLYYLDGLATCVKVPFATHGFGGVFCIGILDQYYNPDLKESEAYDILKLCVREIHQRLFLNLPSFQVKVVSKYGITTLPVIVEPTIIGFASIVKVAQFDGLNHP